MPLVKELPVCGVGLAAPSGLPVLPISWPMGGPRYPLPPIHWLPRGALNLYTSGTTGQPKVTAIVFSLCVICQLGFFFGIFFCSLRVMVLPPLIALFFGIPSPPCFLPTRVVLPNVTLNRSPRVWCIRTRQSSPSWIPLLRNQTGALMTLRPVQAPPCFFCGLRRIGRHFSALTSRMVTA